MTISHYLVERALTGTPHPEPGGSQNLVLTAEERRRLLDTVLRTAALLPGAVRALFEAKMDEMVRTGRYGEMRALLDTVLGTERAAGIADHVYERWR